MPEGDVAVARYRPDGTLDDSFGTDGIVTTPMGAASHADAVALAPRGRIVVAGSMLDTRFSRSVFALARYDAAGSLDHTFGRGGTLTTGFRLHDAGADAVAVQRRGKIVAAGASGGFALARYR